MFGNQRILYAINHQRNTILPYSYLLNFGLKLRKKILITGESGFFCKALTSSISQGDSIQPFYLSRSPKSEAAFKVSDYDLTPLLNEEGLADIDCLVHIAAYIPEPENSDVLLDCVDVNVGYTKSLIDFAVKRNIPKFVLVSSFAIFEGIKNGTIDEKTVPAPLTRYAQSKLAAESLLLSSRKKFSAGVSILRPAFTYGKGMKPQRMIPFFIRELSQSDNITVYKPASCLELTYLPDFCRVLLNTLDVKQDVQVVNIVNEVLSKKDLVETLKLTMSSQTNIDYKDDISEIGTNRSVCNILFKELLAQEDISKCIDTFREII